MGVVDTFSKRKRRAEQSGPDVYQYDNLSKPFRNQVIHILRDSIGRYYVPPFGGSSSEHPQNGTWRGLKSVIAREHGELSLSALAANPEEAVCLYFLTAETDLALDVIELSFRVIDGFVRKMDSYDQEQARIRQSADNAIGELNTRFRENKIGYEFCDGMIHKVDSQYIQSQAVAPALQLLQDEQFTGAEDEFQSAHRHYRDGRNKEAVVDALKAFESTMKTIADRLEWTYSATATAKALIDLMFSEKLFPSYLESQLGSLRNLMASGVPTVRNKTSGHGQGETPKDVSSEIAAYAMHLAAANILLLVQSYRRIAKTDQAS